LHKLRSLFTDIYYMRKYLFLALMIALCNNLFGLFGFLNVFKELDYTLSSGFTGSTISGKTVKKVEQQQFKYKADNGIMYGASAAYTFKSGLEVEGGVRYLERGYELHSRHHRYYHHRNHYYYLHRHRRDRFFDEFKSNYVDSFIKVKPDFGDGLEMHDLNVKLKPFLGVAYSYLLEADDLNINEWDTSLLIGCDVVFAKRFVLGLEYNKGMTNILYDGRAKNECFSTSLGILF
ncbi:MAG: hypothetical protein FWG20_06345, partial [Candidatus Cloacimonetes bacterium]|nr:hypothetical protein [Candidatus Cloacimonadota bacterium]